MPNKVTHITRKTFLALVFLSFNVCHAQTLGYISGYLNNQYTVAGFSTASGQLVKSFPDGLGNGLTFAVSSDGLTLYVPGSVGVYPNLTGVLNAVSAATGEVVGSIALALPGQKVVLSGNGSKAFVLEGTGAPNTIVVQAIDLVAGAVLGSIVLPSQRFRFPVDIAVSPDSSRLFVSLNCENNGSCSSPLPAPCTINKGLCIYDASTLAFVAEIPHLTGLLSVSQDSNSLYVAVASAGALIALNTQTLIQSQVRLGGYVSGPPVMSPLGEYAVVFIGSGAPGYESKAAILDTNTNKFVKTLFAVAPGDAEAVSEGLDIVGVSALAAFAPDGQSIWALLACGPNGCSLPNGATTALAGFAFPSGALIADVPVSIQPGYAVSIAFPQVVKQ